MPKESRLLFFRAGLPDDEGDGFAVGGGGVAAAPDKEAGALGVLGGAEKALMSSLLSAPMNMRVDLNS